MVGDTRRERRKDGLFLSGSMQSEPGREHFSSCIAKKENYRGSIQSSMAFGTAETKTPDNQTG